MKQDNASEAINREAGHAITSQHHKKSTPGDAPSKKKYLLFRWFFYILGMLILAMGLTLNTKTGLGSSAIISVPYTISEGLGLSFADLTLILYVILVAAQFILNGKDSRWTDLLQIVLSIFFTRFLKIFENLVHYQSGYLPTDLLVLVVAVVFTGVGAAMTVDMDLVPNPGDGIVNCVAKHVHKPLGLTKNIFDICCVALSLLIGALLGNPLYGVGLGTIVSMVGVGRSIAVFNHFAKAPMQRLSGLLQDEKN